VHSNGQVVPAHQAADLFAAVRRHWPIVLAIVTVALVGAVVVTASAVKQYDATAKVLLTSGEPVEQIRSAGSRPLDSERDVNTSVELVSVESVAKSVRDELKLPDSVAALQARVRATLEGNSNVLAITVRDRAPRRAAKIASAFARRYIIFRRKAAAQRYREAASLAAERLAALPPSQRGSATGKELDSRRKALQTAADLQTGNSQVLDRATPPASPSTPRTKFNLAVAIIVGLLLGCSVAVVLTRRYPELRSLSASTPGGGTPVSLEAFGVRDPDDD